MRSGFGAQPESIARQKSSFVLQQIFRARQNSVVPNSSPQTRLSPASCEIPAARWSASMAFENAPRRPRSRQCSNRTRTARYASPARTLGALAGTNFLRSDVVSLLEDHPMKLVPIVEIIQIHCVFRSRGVVSDLRCTENAFARLVIVNVTADCGVMFFDRLAIY